MDAAGIEASLNFPTFPRFAGQAFSEAHDKDLGFACIQAYNDWMVDEWCADPRLVPITLVPFWIRPPPPRRSAATPGGVRAIVFSEIPGLPGLAVDPRRGPLLGSPVRGVRRDGGGGVHAHRIGIPDALTSADAPPAVQSTATFTNCMLSMCDWLFSGLLERYPDAQDRLLGGPDRMDPVHPRAGRPRMGDEPGVGWCGRRPSPTRRPLYFARQIYGCFFSDRFGLENLADIGEDNVMFECDYPHSDSTWPDTLDVARE